MEASPSQQQAPVDPVQLLIETLSRQLSTDDSGDQFITFERGDGRRLVRVATFHDELLLPHLEKIAPLQAQNQPLPDALIQERRRIERQRAAQIEQHLRSRRQDLEAYVEGD